jgi:DNA-binding transcriptional LysR family regulator
MNPRDIRSLDVGMLRTFDALMRERSVSRAAARLFLSQPAVSASLNRLREVFDDPLFTRTGHGVTPTPRAQALARRWKKCWPIWRGCWKGIALTRRVGAASSAWPGPTLPAAYPARAGRTPGRLRLGGPHGVGAAGHLVAA